MTIAPFVPRRRWASPPGRPVKINPSHWAADRVRCALIACQWGAYDAVRGVIPTVQPESRMYAGELAFSSPKSGFTKVGDYDPKLDVTQPASIFLRGRITYVYPAARWFYFGATYGWMITVVYSGSELNFAYGGIWTGSRAGISIPNTEMVSANRINTAALSWVPGAQTSREVTVSGFYDGRDYGSTFSTGAKDPGLTNKANSQYGMLSHQYANTRTDNQTSCGLILSGTMTFAEYKDLHNDVFALFMPRDTPVFYSLPSSGPILSFPGVTDITPGSARPKVTLTF